MKLVFTKLKHKLHQTSQRRLQRIKDRVRIRAKKLKVCKKKTQEAPETTSLPISTQIQTTKPRSTGKLQGKLKTIWAPDNFSVLDNSDEVIEFFDDMRKNVLQKRPIHVDLSEVKNLSPETVLYLIATLDGFEQLGKVHHVQGNVPKLFGCSKLLRNSGFLKHVKIKGKQPPPNPNYLCVEKGSKVHPLLARNIVQFCIDHFGEQLYHRNNLQCSILEMIMNTWRHAFPDNEKGTLRWYVMGVHDKEKHTVRLCFLDNGFGIPTHVHKHWKERIATNFPLLGLIPPTDADLMRSAFNGDFRTSTRKRNHGTGLPAIARCVDAGSLQNLKVMSNKGYLDFGARKDHNLGRGLRGTLYSWDTQW